MVAPLSKLKALEAALEYLIKAEPNEELIYITGKEEELPEDTPVHRTDRNAVGYYPSEIGQADKVAEDAQDLDPAVGEEREVEGVTAPEVPRHGIPASGLEGFRDKQRKIVAQIEGLDSVPLDDIATGGYSNVIKWSDAKKLTEPTLLHEYFLEQKEELGIKGEIEAGVITDYLTGRDSDSGNDLGDGGLYTEAKKLGLDKVTVWHGTTGTNAAGILTEGVLRGDDIFGPGFNMSPDVARTWASLAAKDIGELPIIIQFEIPVELLKNVNDDEGITHDQSNDAYTFRDRNPFPLDLETSKIVYNDDPDNLYPYRRFSLLTDDSYIRPQNTDGQIELHGVPRNLLKKIEQAPESSSYEMPKYDMSWDALESHLETLAKDNKLNFIPITEGLRSGPFSNYFEDTDNVHLSIGNTTYFGESEEDIKDKLLKEYASSEGRFFKGYSPPRLTPKPDWATDENDPFPEIPSDIKEIHYDDIPDFYTKSNFGRGLKQFDSLRGIARRIAEKAGGGSEIFYEALKCVDGELDYSFAAGAFSEILSDGVSERQAKLALDRLSNMTKKSLEHRGLPEKFYVFRGGKIHNEDNPMPTSLQPHIAALDYFSQKEKTEPYVAMYEVNRDDVLLDMNSMKEDHQEEEELIILGRNLKNPIMLRLPNQMVSNPDFHKSKVKTDNLSKLIVLQTALEYLTKATPGEDLEYLSPNEKSPDDTRIVTTDRGARGYYPSEVGQTQEESEVPSELPSEERELQGVQAPEVKTETDSTIKLPETATLREEFVTDPETGQMKAVPRTSSGEPPTHVFRVMDKRQYDDAVDRGSLRAVSPDKGGDGRIYAAGGPRFQFGDSSSTVLVAIEYSDDDGWRARWSHTGPDLSGQEVSVAVDSPPYSIDMSKVKLIAEGANGRELRENYEKLRPELQDVQDPDDEDDGQVADPYHAHTRGGKVMAEVMEGLRNFKTEKLPETATLTDLTQIGGQLGSTEGGQYQDKRTGEKFYLKYGDPEHNAVEHLASTLYTAAGVPLPEIEMIDFGDKRALKSKWVDDPEAWYDSDDQDKWSTSDDVKKHFAVDAWLANWDVMGNGMDNIVSSNDNMYRIDLGGSLYKRAQGADKQQFFTEEVGELETLRNPNMNRQAATVFQDVSDDDIKDGVQRIANISDSNINKLVQQSEIPKDMHDEVAETLISRKNWLMSEYGVKAEDSNNLSKLLVLNTALEILQKMNPGEELIYITDHEEELPENTRKVTTDAGAIGYYPSEIGQHNVEAMQEDLGDSPEAEQEVEAVVAPEAIDQAYEDAKLGVFQSQADFDISTHFLSGETSKEFIDFSKLISDIKPQYLEQLFDEMMSKQADASETRLAGYREYTREIREEDNRLQGSVSRIFIPDYVNEKDDEPHSYTIKDYFQELKEGNSPWFDFPEWESSLDNMKVLGLMARRALNSYGSDSSIIKKISQKAADNLKWIPFFPPTTEWHHKELRGLLFDLRGYFIDISRQLNQEILRDNTDKFNTWDRRDLSYFENVSDFVSEDIKNKFIENIENIDWKSDIQKGKNLLPPLEEWPSDFQKAIRGISKKGTEHPSLDIVIALEALFNATSFGNVHHKVKEHWENSSSSLAGGILKDLIGKLYDGKVKYHNPWQFGIPEGKDPSAPADIRSTVTNDYHHFRNFYFMGKQKLERYVRITRKINQELLDLAFPDTDTFELYRGSAARKHFYTPTWEEKWKKPQSNFNNNFHEITDAHVEANPVTSWTVDLEIAKNFADTAIPIDPELKDEKGTQLKDGLIYRTSVNKEDIFAFFGMFAHAGNEREFMLINQPRYTEISNASLINPHVKRMNFANTGFHRTELTNRAREQEGFSKVGSSDLPTILLDFNDDHADWLQVVRRQRAKKEQESTNLSKLLALETALEYLIKAPKKKLEYVEEPSDVPDDTPVITTDRGATAYNPDQVGSKASEVPSEEREVEVVTAEDADDDNEDLGKFVGEKISEQAFIDKAEAEGLHPLAELKETLPRVSLDEQKELTRQAALAGKGPNTDATPITPNIAVTNDKGEIVKITTADGQLQAVQEVDPENPKKGGKLNLYFSDDPTAKVQVRWRDSIGRQMGGYSVLHTKQASISKFNKIKQLAERIPAMLKRCAEDIKNNTKAKEAALALSLVHNTVRRIGKGNSIVTWDGQDGRPGPKKGKDGKFIREVVPTFGVTSFQARHVLKKGNKVFLNFLGKSGKLNNVEVTDPVLKAELLERKKVLKNSTKPVLRVSPDRVNKYLQAATKGDFTVKNFRTWQGTSMAAELIANMKIPKLDRKRFDSFMLRQVKKGGIKNSQDWKEVAFLWALKEHQKLKLDLIGEPVSEKLSNTKAVAISNYIDPAVFVDWDEAFEAERTKLVNTRSKAILQAAKAKKKKPAKAKKKRRVAKT